MSICLSYSEFCHFEAREVTPSLWSGYFPSPQNDTFHLDKVIWVFVWATRSFGHFEAREVTPSHWRGHFASPKMTFSLTSSYLSICLSYSKFCHFEAREVTPSHWSGYFPSPKMTFSLTSSYLSICLSYSKFCHFEDREVYFLQIFVSPRMRFSHRLSCISIYLSYSKFCHFEAREVTPSHWSGYFASPQNDIFTYIKLYEYLSELLELFSFWSWGSKSFTLKRPFRESQNDIFT